MQQPNSPAGASAPASVSGGASWSAAAASWPASSPLAAAPTLAGQGCTTVTICPAERETLIDKWLPSAPALTLSLIAVVFSVKSYRHTQSKDLRARRQSVDDEYWLRKIASPLSIEPFLKYAHEVPLMVGALHDAIGQQPTSAIKATALKLNAEVTKKLGELGHAFMVLGLVDNRLAADVEAQVERVEEVVGQHLGHLAAHLDDPNHRLPDFAQFKAGMAQQILLVLKRIKDQQSQLGARA